MAALGTVAHCFGAPIFSSCSCAGGSILLASEPDADLNSRKKHCCAAIPGSLPDKKSGIFLRRDKRGDPRPSRKGRWAARHLPHLVLFFQMEERTRKRSR